MPLLNLPDHLSAGRQARFSRHPMKSASAFSALVRCGRIRPHLFNRPQFPHTLTQSTCICCGNTVEPSGLPTKFPPTATFRRMKICPWNSDVLFTPFAMLPSKYCTRSTYHLIEVAVRAMAYVWNPAASDGDELKIP